MSNTQPAGALPRHIGIIMDGNGRWASRRGLPRSAGPQASRTPPAAGPSPFTRRARVRADALPGSFLPTKSTRRRLPARSTPPVSPTPT